MNRRLSGAALAVAACLASAAPATLAAPTSVLFVGNSYTFGRIDPVMSYNAARVHDLTAAMWAANSGGSNAFEPHPWSGVAGIFKRFTEQAGLDYDVSLSTPTASPRATCTRAMRRATACWTCGSTTARTPASTARTSAR